MQWIYLSPHFDDAALSCGGLIWEQAQAGEAVSIWTVCAGDQPAGPYSPFAQSLHARWGSTANATRLRQAEDVASCQRMGAGYHHFTVPDCIYRRDPAQGDFLYASEQSLNGSLHPAEADLAAALGQELDTALPALARVVCPLTLGNHVDHQLTRQAAERTGRPLWFYADYPYSARPGVQPGLLIPPGWQEERYSISAKALSVWQDAVAAHASQISTFWESEAAMRAALAHYMHQYQGIHLWKGP